MKSLVFGRYAFSFCAPIAMLSACSGAPSWIGGLGAIPQSMATGTSFKTLHSFGKGSDGVYPEAALIDVKGALYGTTAEGGAYNDGSVFRISTNGTEKVLHSFGKGYDGRVPVASLIDVKGRLLRHDGKWRRVRLEQVRSG